MSDRMFCPNCGAENERNMSFCGHCGVNFQEALNQLSGQKSYPQPQLYAQPVPQPAVYQQVFPQLRQQSRTLLKTVSKRRELK